MDSPKFTCKILHGHACIRAQDRQQPRPGTEGPTQDMAVRISMRNLAYLAPTVSHMLLAFIAHCGIHPGDFSVDEFADLPYRKLVT